MDYQRAEAKQAARERVTGLWAATTTPFGPDGAVDEAALRADIDRLTGELHVDGIFCGGVMSEFWALSVAERRRLTEVVVAQAGRRCPVLAHTGHHSAAETIGLTRHAAEAGADFVAVINPYYPPASDEGLYEWYARVCASVDIGVWLFDTSYAGVSLSDDLIARLAAIDNVVGIKVGRDHARYLALLARFGGQILVCSPHEETWLADMRDHAQRAYMSSAAPYLYQRPDWQPMREYTRLALAGEFAKAEEVAATLEPVRAVAARWLRGRPRQADNLASIKAWAGLAGLSGGPVRPPLVSLAPAQQAELADELAGAGLLPPGHAGPVSG
ncbi:MAG: dihydrodipicolinate synthase family protein [Nocardiopsaceae bacterium]|jgi:4-hydroxy-tetrahydrodipicolinate synthase|nr:dihydrodipicolinate synthase family protein [Nocardiopsaceae bacterium]